MQDKNKNNNNNNEDTDEGVAVIGIGFRIPSGGNGNPLELWNCLKNGFNGAVKTSERWSDTISKSGEISSGYAGLLNNVEMKSFDPLFFGISPSEADSIDPQQRLLLKCTWEALENAQIDPFKIRGTNTPVFIGCSTNDYAEINKTPNHSASTNIFGGTVCSIANRVSYCFDFRGESMTIDTACSSSLNAIRLGYNSIKYGSSNLSITGGTNLILDPFVSKSFTYLNMTSKSGKSSSFDADADGFVRSEGTGIIVMKRLKDAIADGNNIYCVIYGASSNVDSSGLSDKSNFYAPSKSSQSVNIKQALLSTNGLINANDIDYIEAHGTGTPTGDPIECEGISMALTRGGSTSRLPSNPLLIGSIKSNIGHCEAASGVMSLIKCCLMYKYQYFAPNINFKTPNPAIKFDEWNLKVVTQLIPFPTNKKVSMAINNFGVTGSNCCLVLSQHVNVVDLTSSKQPQLPQPQQNYMVPFSANSIKSLQQYQSKINQNIDFSQFAQQQIKSKSIGLVQRSIIISSNWNEFNDQQSNLIKTDNDKLISNMSLSSIKKNVNMVFIFCGQGPQYQTMGKQLYNTEPIFKQSMDKIDVILTKYYGFSVLDKLRSVSIEDTHTIHDPYLAQPSILMIQISLFELYNHWGITPSFIIGHSLGEITSAYCSGMIDLESVCYLIYHRSIAQSKTNGSGKMMSINISSDEFKLKYSKRYPLIEIACYNSPSSTVIGGDEIQLDEISLELKEQGIFSVMLGSLASYHTSSQLVIKDDILNLQFNSTPPTTPTFSTVTSSLFNGTTLKFNSEYVFENIYKSVQFSKTISNLYQHIETNELGNEIIFIEIAPHPTLSFHLNQMIPKQSKYFKNGSSISIFSPLSKKKLNDQKEIQTMISKLYCQGYSQINFKCQLLNKVSISNGHIDLPLYQWDEKEYWMVSSNFKDYFKNGTPINHLGTSNSFNSPLFKSYQTFIDIGKPHFQWLKGHELNKGKCYFPGVGYIDNILNLFGQPSTTTTVEQPQQKLPDIYISFMEFKVPLILIEGINTCLQTNIYQTGKKEYKSVFHYRDVKNEQWIQTCGANFQLFNNSDNEIQKYNIEELISNKFNLTRVSKQELYNKCKIDASLEYGGLFRSLEECYIGNDCSLSKISLELPLVNQSSSFLFPSIIDCCLHGSFALLEEQGQYVFDHFEGLKYYSSRVPFGNEQSKHTHIFSLTQFVSKQDNSMFIKVIVCLRDGTVIFEIERLVLTSTVPIKDSLSIEYPKNELFSTFLQSKDSPIPTPSTFNNIYQDDRFKSTKNEFLSNTSNLSTSQMVSEIIQESIKPILNEKMVFRILEFGGGICSLSELVLDKINSLLLEYPKYQIDIEYTWSDISPSFIPEAKLKLSKFRENINIIYKSLNLEIPLIGNYNQGLLPSYYDYVIMSNVLHVIKDVENSVDQIYKLLTPCGHLLFVEPSYKSLFSEKTWLSLLKCCNFNEDIKMFEETVCFVIQAQKPSLLSLSQQHSIQPPSSLNDNIIIYGNNESFIKIFNQQKNVQIISTIQSLNEFISGIDQTKLSSSTIIYFIKSTDQLTIDNFKEITFEYIQINQMILNLNLTDHIKHVLITCESESSNYLSSSLIGSARYFDEYNQLKLFTLSFDSISLNDNTGGLSNLINILTDSTIHIQREFIIKNNQVYFERYKNETKLSGNFKSDSNYQIQQSVLGKNIIITGQSGIVFEVLKWIVKYSSTIENIIILSKSSIKWHLELFINKMKLVNDKIKFHFKSIDVSNSLLVEQSISEILSDNPTITNIDSIFHYAFTQIDCDVNEISMNELNVSHGAKTMGAINLHEQSIQRGWKLINFVIASSVASLLGSYKQCSYVSACNVLDSLSRYRVSLGFPCISINYGYIKTVGFVSKNESVSVMLDCEGLAPISTNTILGSLDIQLQNQLKCTNSIVCSFTNDFTPFKNQSLLTKFDYLLNKLKQDSKQLNDLSSNDKSDDGLTESIINKISKLLSIDSAKINQEIRLIDYGADSLVIVSLKNQIEKEFSVPNIISIQQLQNKTIQDSISFIKTGLNKNIKEIGSTSSSNNFGSFERKLKINTQLSNKEFWNNELNIDDLINEKSNIKQFISGGTHGNDIKVFITGTTGLLGVYLLSHLLQLSTCLTVYCLIRNKSKSNNPIDEIISNLKHHKLFDQLTNDKLSKIVVIVGDLSLKKFGIPQQEYLTLVENVNLIINSGADINLESNYQSNKTINVDGVNECIKLSITHSPPMKIVNFSSFTVFYNKEFRKEQAIFDESILPSLDDIDNLPAGYMQSKVIAEHMLIKSSEQFGIPSMIIRPPSIFANHHTGIGHESDFTHLLLQSCYILKVYPLNEFSILVNPITWLSNNIINLILNENCWNSYNQYTSIYNVHGDIIKSSSLFKILNSLYGFKGIDFNEWKELLYKSNHKSCMKLRTFHSLDLSRYKLHNNIKLSSSTKLLLKSMGSFGDEDTDGFKLTGQMIINHINYKFN